jgi:hypothetical protein
VENLDLFGTEMAPVETGKIEGGKFLARCAKCGRWLEVHPEPGVADGYFEVWVGDFFCCATKQKARFTREKDYLDFH